MAAKIDYWIENPQEKESLKERYVQQGNSMRVSTCVAQAEKMYEDAIADFQHTSLLGNLGFIPKNSKFACAEVKRETDWTELQQKYPYLTNCNHLCSSDAHDLNTIHEPIYTISCPDTSRTTILAAIQKKL